MMEDTATGVASVPTVSASSGRQQPELGGNQQPTAVMGIGEPSSDVHTSRASTTPVKPGARRDSISKAEQEKIKRRRLEAQLQQNAEMLVVLEGLQAARNGQPPAEVELQLATELLGGIATASAHFPPKVVNLDPQPVGLFVKGARGMNMLPLMRDEQPVRAQTGGYTIGGCGLGALAGGDR